MTYYSPTQMQTEVDRVIKITREETLRVERERVQRAIYLFANTSTDERISAAVYELLGFIYETRTEEDAANV